MKKKKRVPYRSIGVADLRTGESREKGIQQGGNIEADLFLAAHGIVPFFSPVEAELRNTNLIGKDLSNANLIGADLNNVNLSWANLSNAHLSNANLIGADLSNANLIGANLSGANLSGTKMYWAKLREANLREAKYDTDTKWPAGFDPVAAGASLAK